MVCINNYSFLLLNTFINGYIKTPRPSYISSGYICSILFFIFPGKKNFFFFCKIFNIAWLYVRECEIFKENLL